MKKLLFTYPIILLLNLPLSAQEHAEFDRYKRAVYLEVSSIVIANSVNLFYESRLLNERYVCIHAQMGGGIFSNIFDIDGQEEGVNVQMGALALLGRQGEYLELGAGWVGTNQYGERHWNVYGKAQLAYRVDTESGFLLKFGLQAIIQQSVTDYDRIIRGLPMGFGSIGYAF